MIHLQIQTSDEDNGYAHVQVHRDAQQILHLIAVKTGFTKDASLDPLQEPTAIGIASNYKWLQMFYDIHLQSVME